jgi:hypothetical protein
MRTMAKMSTISPPATSANPMKYELRALMQPVLTPPMLVELDFVEHDDERPCSLVINHVPTTMELRLSATAILFITPPILQRPLRLSWLLVSFVRFILVCSLIT